MCWERKHRQVRNITHGMSWVSGALFCITYNHITTKYHMHLTNYTNLNLIVLGNMGNYWGNFGYPRYDQHLWKIVHFPYPRMQLVRNIMPFPAT